MAKMHGKRLFTGIENVKGLFLFEIVPVHEIEHPFRSSDKSLLIHILPGKALVLGWWRKKYNETENLLRALGGRVHATGKEEIRGYIRPEALQQEQEESNSPFFS